MADANSEKLDKLLAGLTSITTRLDAVESKSDSESVSKLVKDAFDSFEKKMDAKLDAHAKRLDAAEKALKEEREENNLEEYDEEEVEKARHDALKAGHKIELRGDVEGYEEGGEFHPIRGSKGYSRSEAGEGRKRRKRRHDEEEERKAKEREDAEKAERERKEREDAEKREKEDRERRERHDAQLSSLTTQNAELLARLKALETHVTDTPTDDRARFAEIWGKGDHLAQLHCDSQGAPKWAPGESLHTYTCRVLDKFKKFSATWKDVDLSKITEPGAFAIATTQICNDAEAAATDPENVPANEMRKIVDRSTGREIIRWVACNDDACWRQFTNVSFMVGKFKRPQGAVAA